MIITAVRSLIDEHFSLQWCRKNNVVPIEVRREVALRGEPSSEVLVIAVGNFEYLGTIGKWIKERAAKANYSCQFIEKDPDIIQTILSQAAEIRRIEGLNTESITYDEDALEAALLQVAEETGDDFGISFDDGGDIEIPEQNIDDISTELLGSAIQRSAAQILIKAVKDEVSDIHIEPQESDFRIRFRQDGVLNKFLTIPRSAGIKLTACIKNMAKMNIAEKRSSQDGRILRHLENNKLEFRVSTLPSKFGEKTVLRVLRSDPEMLHLDTLIANKDVLKSLRNMISQPFGIIIVAGPTGSGKSTTLYSVLSELNTGENNIVTAEDPIEYSLPGITQVQVLKEKNQTFPMILRSFLRQDPDVILIGETRDPETANTSMEAAQTGHLVLTTLHANNSASSITRLLDLDVPDYLITSTLLGVLSQRLVRRLCTECSLPRPISEAEALLTNLRVGTPIRIAQVLSSEERTLAKQENRLCPRCHGVGYRGRLGVYELMPVNRTIKDAIKTGKSTQEIQELATMNGMKTLEDYGRELVRDGLTSVAELQKLVSMAHN